MASVKKEFDATGAVVYKIQASAGRGRRVKRSWRPEPGWSAKTIERELQKFCANLENELAAGTVSTHKEKLEQERIAAEEARLAALEAERLKTVQQYVDGVYWPSKLPGFSENTRSSYSQFLKNVILPALGEQLLKNVTPAMLKKVILDYQQAGHALASCIKLYNICNGLFEMAFLDESIETNPMLRVPRPKQSKDEQPQDEESKAYTVEQLNYILECLEKEPLKWRAYITLMSDTGVRRGECSGIQWRDIDWKKQTVTIRRNVQYTPQSGVYTTTPKNRKVRTVDIGPDTIALLRQLQQEQASACISKWVFTQDGTQGNDQDVMNPQSPTRYFKKFGQRYGIEDFHPHKLRHTSASLALANGADLVSVSARMGHSDTAVTAKVYAHAYEDGIRRAGQIVRDALKAKQA